MAKRTSWFGGLFRKAAAPPVRPAVVRARYDAAETTSENRQHWALTDSLSAAAANSLDVRKKLRERARYEVANNSYARGIVNTLANDTIGTGPRVQVSSGDAERDQRIAAAFARWAEADGLAEKLRTMRMARAVDGEAFAVLRTNPLLTTPVKLCVRLYEADQVATPYFPQPEIYEVDGIRFDEYGNPRIYFLLRDHPGDRMRYVALEHEEVPASLMIHWFRADRPGQARGVPDLTPSLPLFHQLRRYTLAVIAAAETAADFAAVLHSDLAPDDTAVDGEPFETLEITRRMMTTLPAGWKMSQFKAEQPATTYEMFKREILKEVARCLNVPYNVAAGDSSAYNYASGRLDHQTYFKSLAVEQRHLELAVLDRILAAWVAEARIAEPELFAGVTAMTHRWFWPGHEHVDPVKEATAQQIRLQNHATTLADEWAKVGADWREKLEQRAAEVEYANRLGLFVDLTPNANVTQKKDGEADYADQ